jgi:hypothetical protein
VPGSGPHLAPFRTWSLCALLAAAAGCGSGPPASPAPTLTPFAAPVASYAAPPAAPTPTVPCQDDLAFLADLTIPDYSSAAPGSILDKRWLVQNSGSCNWDGRYRLRLVAGEALGAAEEYALYPARAGMQADVRILFTAPAEAGSYYSEWQAFDPDGLPFGESFAIRISVQY